MTVLLNHASAFTSASHDFLWEAFEIQGLLFQLMHVSRAIYDIAATRIGLKCLEWRQFRIDRAVRQGCPMPAALWAPSFEPVVRRTQVPVHLRAAARLSVFADGVAILIDNGAATWSAIGALIPRLQDHLNEHPFPL